MIMINGIFERFIENVPLTVMVRAILERIFAPEALDEWFEQAAEKQYTRDLLFSTVVSLMSLVVMGTYPSVSAAYKGFEKVIGVSKVALYAKINGMEPNVAEGLVRHTSEQLLQVQSELRPQPMSRFYRAMRFGLLMVIISLEPSIVLKSCVLNQQGHYLDKP